jgi:hypothetical protein
VAPRRANSSNRQTLCVVRPNGHPCIMPDARGRPDHVPTTWIALGGPVEVPGAAT